MAMVNSLLSDFGRLTVGNQCLTRAHTVITATQDDHRILELMDRTGYSMIQQNGQRKYGGPPPGWEGEAPPRGCEVFVGRIPRDCYEDELVPIFEEMGKIYELRLMMDFSGANRGYAFVMYTSKGDAQRAVKEMNNYEIRKGRFLGVCQSVDNCRLFVGGIPKSKTKEEIREEMEKVTEGVVDVIVYPSANDKSKNRGFAFVEYDSHRAAAMARRKLIPGRIQLWGHQIAVDWAEPENEVDEDIMKTVKILYVRNLMLTTTEEHLEQVFNRAADPQPPGKKAVERVKKLKDYAFVHFSEREEALRALKAINGTLIDGSRVEVVLAKPVDKNDPKRQSKNPSLTVATTTQPFLSNMIPALPYDPQTMNAYYAQFGAALQTTSDPLAMGVYPGMSGIAAAPLMGRPSVSRPTLRGRGRGAAGSRAASARLYAGQRRKSSSPAELESFIPRHAQRYDILADMKLTPKRPSSILPSTSPQKQPVKVLELLCQKNGWGIPIYQLNSTGDQQLPLYLFKVVIPALANSTPGAGMYVPNKLCRTEDEAQSYAAEYVLMALGMPYDGSGGVVPTSMPGMMPGLSLPMGAAMNYLGQPITAQTMPQLANGMDLSTLSAYASLQGLGYPMSTAMTMANQPTMIMAENNNMMPLQSPTELAASMGITAATSPQTDINAAFGQYS